MTVPSAETSGNLVPHVPRRFRRRRVKGEHPHGKAALALAFALVMAGFALGVARAALVAVGNLNLPGPLFIPPPEPAPVVVTPPRRVLVFVVDGMRADVALELPFIGGLARGTHALVQAEMPTYSAAQYVAALAGVRPADSGVRGNVGLLRTPLDSVPRRLRAAGRSAVELGDDVDWWFRLFGDDWTTNGILSGSGMGAGVRAQMDAADLLWVHLTKVDLAGHTVGVADPAYLAAAREVDDTVRELSLAWGWPAATVAVFSDHGHHWPKGGHGGDEPDVRGTFLALGGPGVEPGARVASAHLVDLAPTLAALLGVPSPAQAQGRTLVELLDLDAGQRHALATSDVARQARVAEAVAAGRRGLEINERRGQLLRGVSVLLCLGLVVLVVRRVRPRARLGLLVGGATLAVTAACYLEAFETISFSADRDASNLTFHLIAFGFMACGLTFAAPIVAVVTRRLRPSDACAFGFLAVVGASPLALAMFVLCGAFTARIACEPAWLAAGPLLAYGALLPVCSAACVLGLFAAIMALIPRRPPPRRLTSPLHAEARP